MKNKTADRKWIVKQLSRLPKVRANPGFVKGLMRKLKKYTKD